jgi:hypothetical protein
VTAGNGPDRVADRQLLWELVQRYCFYSDGDHWDRLGPLFTDDIDFARAIGRDAVMANMAQSRSAFGRSIHTPHGLVVDFVDDDHATGIVPTHAEIDMGGVLHVCAMKYDDEYRREDGVWRFAKRRIRYAYMLPWSELGTALSDATPIRWPGGRPKVPDDFWAV